MYIAVSFLQGTRVWQSLSDVLVCCVEGDITSPVNVEALWLCRWQRLHQSEVIRHFITV